MSDYSITDFAKAYARRHFECFPLQARQKTPAVKWADVATSEENMLVGWFENDPNANIGIACGKRSGIVVLDVDEGHDGYTSLANLEGIYGKLPLTPIAKTGGGGEHIFFKHPGVEIRNSASKLGAGLDIRGDGGYVVAAPSIHPNGNRYEWVIRPSDDVDFADMPAWMIEILQARGESPAPLPVSANGKIANGSRNATLTSLAGTMRRRGFDEDAMFVALKSHNEKYCIPPLSDGEVLQVAKSVMRYEPSAPVKVKEAPQITNVEDLLDEIEREAREREANPTKVWGIPYAWNRLSEVTGGKHAGELIYVAGDSGIGKSWWAHQDAAYTAIYQNTPSLIWSGEMKRKQVLRRVMYMLGVDRDAMLTGFGMSEYWQDFNTAKALIQTAPLHICDDPLSLDTVDAFLEREIKEHGVKQALFDYDRLIEAEGKSDIEKSQNVSRFFKQAVNKHNISIMLISSMNKMGMDATGEAALKSHMSGSGQKVYDSDIIYIFTPVTKDSELPIELMAQYRPADYHKLMNLHFSKGRELSQSLTTKKILFARETPRPSFMELTK